MYLLNYETTFFIISCIYGWAKSDYQKRQFDYNDKT